MNVLTSSLYRRFFAPSHRQAVWFIIRRDARIHGRDVVGWHATNIALHVVCSLIVYAILRGLYSETAAALGAALFASHPTATSSVANMSGRFGLLCAVGYFGALLAVMIGGWAWLFVLPLFVLGWASKEEIASWPFAALATLMLMRWL